MRACLAGVLAVKRVDVPVQRCPGSMSTLPSSTPVKKRRLVAMLERKSGPVDRLREGVWVPSMDPGVVINNARKARFLSPGQYTEDRTILCLGGAMGQALTNE